jgi:hypothetical protein
MENLVFGSDAHDHVLAVDNNDMRAAIIPASDLHLVSDSHRVHRCARAALDVPRTQLIVRLTRTGAS